MISPADEEYLKDIYFDESHPAGLGSLNTLYNFIKADDKIKISKKLLQKWLEKSEVYTTNVTKRKSKKGWHHRVVTPRGKHLLDIDSAYFKRGGKSKYFILAVDVFTKKLSAFPVNNLKGVTIVEVLKKIFAEIGKPVYIRTDLGSEYIGKDVKNLLIDLGVKHYFAYPPHKANLAERHIRILKNNLQKVIQAKGLKDWSRALPNVVKSYNSRYHKGIGMSPNEAEKEEPANIYWENEFNHFLKLPEPKPYQYQLHDPVRVSLNKSAFDKESDQNFSTKIFYITQRTNPAGIARYTVKNDQNQSISGSFTENEIQKVNIDENTVYRIEKVIGTRERDGVKEVKVRWKDYSNAFDSWVLESELENLV